MATLGEQLIRLLEAYGVELVFGIPGVHTVELYRGLDASAIRHVAPRHEQGAGFMADGYARTSGKPGVAFVITGPGVSNIATAMAQAYADSIPMLVVSSVNHLPALGMEAGALHELRRQGLVAGQCAAFSHTVMTPAQLPAVLARAFAIFEGERPRPVHIEIPVDLLDAPADDLDLSRPAALLPPAPHPDALAAAAAALGTAARPLILAGGGAVTAANGLVGLAETLAAPVVMTNNARGLLPPAHPLAVPASPSLQAVRALIAESDVVLAVASEFGRTDYDMYERGGLAFPGRLIRIEIDAQQMRRGGVPEFPLLGAAAPALAALQAALSGHRPQNAEGAARAAATRQAAMSELSPAMRADLAFLDRIRARLGDAAIVGDSTQAVYAGSLYHAAPSPRSWFNSSTGYGTLGYAPPAAIGAALASGRRVVSLAGDGGFQFTAPEISVAVETAAPVLFIVWNNRGYGEIKRYMVDAGIAPVGVDLQTPDFVALGRACGLRSEKAETLEAFDTLLKAAAAAPGPMLIEIDEAVARDFA